MTDTQLNGERFPQIQELDELAAARVQAAAEQQYGTPIREDLKPSPTPFGQQQHDLLLRSVDQVASDWVSELDHVRHNSEQVEQLVLERAAKVKTDLTMLFLLGQAVLSEAKRGDEVNAKLVGELDKLKEHAP
jgi:hypothetical protein